jgi:hypothetical protein
MLDAFFLTDGKLKEWARPLLLNAGSAYLGVDGSAAPVVFSWGPAAGRIFRVHGAFISWVSTTGLPTEYDGLLSKVSVVGGDGLLFGLKRASAYVYDFFDFNNTPTTAAYCETNADLFMAADGGENGSWNVTFTDSGQVHHAAFGFRRDGGAIYRMVGDSADTAALTVASDMSSCLVATARLVGRYE